MNLENIVVVFTTTSHKKKTFDYGIHLAKKLDSKITVLKCLYKQPPTFGFFETKGDKRKKESQKQSALKSLEEFESVGQKSNIPVSTKVVLSDPISKGIISYTDQKESDLVILDSPKLKHYEEAYFDNTVSELHKGLNCPLLIID